MFYDQKKPIIIFEIGHLQVFGMQTLEEWTQKILAKDIYWKKKGDVTSRGPFNSIYNAVQDYATYINSEKASSELPNNVIFADFKTKKRLK